MRLSNYIRNNMEEILQKWENFAKTLIPPGKVMSVAELRDHAEQMLRAIADDLDIPQTSEEQFAKSVGKGPENKEETASEIHALTRLLSGFTMNEMVSEYRALRASVLTLWIKEVKAGTTFETEDMTRFNEAIDQGLAESIARFTKLTTESQHIFLGILGHDLRTPLGVISLGSEALLRSEELSSPHTKIASRIYTSVKRANKIIENLLDFIRSNLGDGISVFPNEICLTTVCRNIVEEVRAFHPAHTILFEGQEVVNGLFDAARMEQVFSNLMENAIKHGSKKDPVTVKLQTQEHNVIFTVHNKGDPIPAAAIEDIFNPLSRHSPYASGERGSNAGLGLGLYIVNQIVAAHGGKIKVDSQPDSGTTFLVTIPLIKT